MRDLENVGDVSFKDKTNYMPWLENIRHLWKKDNADTSMHYTYLGRQSVKKQKVVKVKLLKWAFFIYNSPVVTSDAKNSERKQKDKGKKRKFTEIF